MMASVFNGLQDIGLFFAIRASSVGYLVLLSVHVVALALFGGMVFMTDLRLLGIGMSDYSVSEVVNGLRKPKRIGLFLVLLSGILLFGSQADQYWNDPWFWTKIALLALLVVNYLLFRRGIYDEHAAELDRSPQLPGRAKMAAGFSLLLWTGVIVTGRGPATIKDIMNSMVDPAGDFLFGSIEQVGDIHGASEKLPRTEADWNAIRQRVAILQEVPSLVDGRRGARPRDRSKNPGSESQPEAIEQALDNDRPSLDRRARRLQNAATLAMNAVNAKDTATLFKSIDGIDKACENCHLHYWYPNDKRAQQAARDDGIKDSDDGTKLPQK